MPVFTTIQVRTNGLRPRDLPYREFVCERSKFTEKGGLQHASCAIVKRVVRVTDEDQAGDSIAKQMFYRPPSPSSVILADTSSMLNAPKMTPGLIESVRDADRRISTLCSPNGEGR